MFPIASKGTASRRALDVSPPFPRKIPLLRTFIPLRKYKQRAICPHFFTKCQAPLLWFF